MLVLLAVVGFSFGMFVSAGAFTVLLAAGMITRFSGKLAIAKHNLLLEECVIVGTIGANLKDMLLYISSQGDELAYKANRILLLLRRMPEVGRYFLLLVNGLFIGIFVGCLAMTIAEVLDAIPIFARRTRMKKGLECATIAIALGKLVGSLVYFKMHY